MHRRPSPRSPPVLARCWRMDDDFQSRQDFLDALDDEDRETQRQWDIEAARTAKLMAILSDYISRFGAGADAPRACARIGMLASAPDGRVNMSQMRKET